MRCNQWIKFDALLERAQTLGADVLATGHYARVRSDGSRYSLLRGVDHRKDQSYVLWMLDQVKLARTLFPVGDMTKSETRRIASELGLRTANKPDSQEICFVRNGDLPAYVDEHIPAANEPGPMVTSDGEQVGEHRGIARYTVGQRKGLGISLGLPVFVSSIDAETNTIVVGKRDQLACAGFSACETSWVDEPVGAGKELLVQYRSHGDVYAARDRVLCSRSSRDRLWPACRSSGPRSVGRVLRRGQPAGALGRRRHLIDGSGRLCLTGGTRRY